MSTSSLVMLLLSSLVMGQTSAPLNATVGQSVLIPCSLPVNSKSLKWIYWQEDGTAKVLYNWHSANGISDSVNNEYKNRCQVSNTDFSSGNISISLNNVSVSDDKKTFWASVSFTEGQPLKHQCKSTLQVSALYKDLKMTINTTVNTATCTTRGGYPEPEVTWTGQNQSCTVQLVGNTSLQQDPAKRTFFVTSTVSIKDLKHVTCSVYNPRCDQRINATAPIDGPDKDQLKQRCPQACCRGYSLPDAASAHSNETKHEHASFRFNQGQEESREESDEPQSMERDEECKDESARLSVAIGLVVLLLSSSGNTLSEANETRGEPWLWQCNHTLSETFQPKKTNIYWQGRSKSDLLLYMYRKGKHDLEFQSQSFKNRTKIFPDQLYLGNVSLIIEELTLQDDKTSLEVIFIPASGTKTLCPTTLYVSAPFQEPKVDINKTNKTATCTTKGGYPKPEITWIIEDGETQTERTLEPHQVQTTMTPEEDGTYSIRSTINVTVTKSQKVTCRVYNPTSNKTKYAKIPPVNTLGVGALVGVGIAALFAVVTILMLLVFGIRSIICRRRGTEAENSVRYHAAPTTAGQDDDAVAAAGSGAGGWFSFLNMDATAWMLDCFCEKRK
ncbi:CD276 antigen-like [Scomber scombrus]